MHVIVATDGSKQSLAAAKPPQVVRRPDEDHRDLGDRRRSGRWPRSPSPTTCPTSTGPGPDTEAGSFRAAAENAVDVVAAEFEGWGPKVYRKVRSGSPANEIIKAAKQLSAGLVVVAAGGRGISDVVLVGSTAQRVQHYAPCPVLVVRPAPRASRRAASKAGRG